MQYRVFGKTGIKVSALGFGAMRLPLRPDKTCDYEKCTPLLRRGIELGINYLDSAEGYNQGTSEVAIGNAIKSFDRSSLYLSTKIPPTGQSGDEWRKQLEAQLGRLETNYIDFHYVHCLTDESFQGQLTRPGGVLAAARQAQEEGLIRYFCFSSHDTPENICTLVETGEFDGMIVQYNLLDRRNQEAIARAHQRGMGVAIMGPIGGGRLALASSKLESLIPGGVSSTPAIALRFVLANPAVSLALSGMNEIAQVEENVATASREEPLSEAEVIQIKAALDENQRLADLYCTGCGYCMPCPNGVDISANFRVMNYHRVYGLTAAARKEYARLGEKKNEEGKVVPAWAAACEECGECEPKCPQDIPIQEQLKETHKTLGEDQS